MQERKLIRFDWALKRLLRNKADYVVLEGFLSVLLGEDIKIISIKESEGNQEHAKDKFNRVDIFVENSKGEFLIIEMQNSEEVDYYYRMLYGVSKAITEHMSIGDDYYNVRKIYHINILYFRMGNGSDYVYHGSTEYRGIHNNTVLQLTEKEREFFTKDNVKDLYPEYYILCVKDFDNVAKNSLDEWIYYLKNAEIPESFTAQGLKEARDALLYDDMTDEEKRAYIHYLNQTRYERNTIKNSYDKGKIEGKIEGQSEVLALLEKGISIDEIKKKLGI